MEGVLQETLSQHTNILPDSRLAWCLQVSPFQIWKLVPGQALPGACRETVNCSCHDPGLH